MPPAARINDDHVCPFVESSGTPHKGGGIIGTGLVSVKIGGMPAAVMGDPCICTGPPDSISSGSTSVKIGGKYAARMTDTTTHGGTIIAGCMSVNIG